MNNLKIGDRVQRLPKFLNHGGWTSDGQTFTVSRVGKYTIGLKEIDGSYFADCFFKVAPANATKRRDYVADHARRTLRKAGLTKDEANDFVAAVQALGHEWSMSSEHGAVRNEQGRFDLSKISRSLRGVGLHHILGDSFSWRTADSALNKEPGYFERLYTKYRDAKEEANA